MNRRWFWLGALAGAVELAILLGEAQRWWASPPSALLVMAGVLGPFGAVGMFVGTFLVPMSLIDLHLDGVFWLAVVALGVVLNGLMYGSVAKLLSWSRRKHRALFAATLGLIVAYLLGGLGLWFSFPNR